MLDIRLVLPDGAQNLSMNVMDDNGVLWSVYVTPAAPHDPFADDLPVVQPGDESFAPLTKQEEAELAASLTSEDYLDAAAWADGQGLPAMTESLLKTAQAKAREEMASILLGLACKTVAPGLYGVTNQETGEITQSTSGAAALAWHLANNLPAVYVDLLGNGDAPYTIELANDGLWNVVDNRTDEVEMRFTSPVNAMTWLVQQAHGNTNGVQRNGPYKLGHYTIRDTGNGWDVVNDNTLDVVYAHPLFVQCDAWVRGRLRDEAENDREVQHAMCQDDYEYYSGTGQYAQTWGEGEIIGGPGAVFSGAKLCTGQAGVAGYVRSITHPSWWDSKGQTHYCVWWERSGNPWVHVENYDSEDAARRECERLAIYGYTVEHLDTPNRFDNEYGYDDD